jgi:hypothetical protein
MACYPASYPGTTTWSSGNSVPVSCRLSAAGLRFLGILCPPGTSAPLTVGLPAPSHRTLTGLPCSARVRRGWGRTSSIPRGRRCPHGRECSTAAACRIATASSLSPRHCVLAREVTLTRHHQGFPVSRPVPSLPLTCSPWSGQGPLGFSMSSAPGRYRPRTSWRRRVQTLTRSHVPASASLHPTDSLLTCDLMSQAFRIPFQHPDIQPPGALRPADGLPVPLGATLLARLLRHLCRHRARAPQAIPRSSLSYVLARFRLHFHLLEYPRWASLRVPKGALAS